MADSDIIVSLHLVIPFISMGLIVTFKVGFCQLTHPQVKAGPKNVCDCCPQTYIEYSIQVCAAATCGLYYENTMMIISDDHK